MSTETRDLSTGGDFLLYDGDCPFCSNYVALLALRRVSPDFRVLNAREHTALWNEALRQGYDIDQDMLLRWNGQFYLGGDALHVLSLIVGQRGLFGRLNRWIFRSPARARWLYPALRWGRNTTLALLGRRRIRASSPSNLSEV